MALTKQFDVITVGDVFINLVMTGFPRWPQPGEEVEAAQLRRDIGGGAVLTACGLARLGCRTTVIAAIGQTDGDLFKEQLTAQGVNARELRLHPFEPTALTVAVSTGQARSFFTYLGANRLLPDLLRDPLVRRALTQARHIHLTHALAPARLVELAEALHAVGTTLSLDAGWMEAWLRDPASLTALRHVDLFFPNERAAAALTGETEPAQMLRAFAAAGLPHVALKLGEHGAALGWEGSIKYIGPLHVTPIDPTGAGACFNAGFLYGWLTAKVPEACLQLANACGALFTQKPGGLAGFPAPAELDARLRF
jgi:sugar/nucleoside kinase (ribokinase family)